MIDVEFEWAKPGCQGEAKENVSARTPRNCSHAFNSTCTRFIPHSGIRASYELLPAALCEKQQIECTVVFSWKTVASLENLRWSVSITKRHAGLFPWRKCRVSLATFRRKTRH